MEHYIIGFANPLLALIFSVSFFSFWWVQKHKRHILEIAISYFAFACGMFISNIGFSAQNMWHVLGTHFFYSVSAIVIVIAVSRRAEQRPETLLMVITAVAVTPILLWLHSISAWANLRIILANLVYCMICLTGALALWRNRLNHALDYWLFVIFTLIALQFMFRPIAMLALQDNLRNSDYINSVYYSTLNVSISVISLSLAISLLAVCLYDYIQDLPKTGEKKQSEECLAKAEAANAAKIARVKAIMNTNIHRQHDLTLSKLAHIVGIHEYALRTIIKDKMGYKNFREFLNSYRLKEAQSALADPANDHTGITTIAFECGFNSIPSFNRVFKAEFAMAPSEFRDQAEFRDRAEFRDQVSQKKEKMP